MLKISIPEPCHEDWNKMNPNEQGRHCDSCAKTVVDFTNMSDDEVKNFFLNKKEERVCGRFKSQQLQKVVIDLPNNIFSIEMPVWKRFLVASLIVFSTTLFSCNTSIDGKLIQNNEITDLVMNATNDLGEISNVTLGISVPQTDTIPRPKTCNYVVGEFVNPVIIKKSEPEVLMGDVDIIPADTTKQKKCEPFLKGQTIVESPLMGLPAIIITKEPVYDGSAKPKKDPPKADSGDCNKKINY